MSQAVDTVVRMGEYAVSATPDDTLLTIGLGSCIGLALLDVNRGIAGLAHIMLPEAPATGAAGQEGKFADTAVPALVRAVLARGARTVRLDAYVVGGAQMFSFGKGALDVGARNDAAVRAALGALRIPVRVADTGGSKGRTIRVAVGAGSVTSKESGGIERDLCSPALRSR